MQTDTLKAKIKKLGSEPREIKLPSGGVSKPVRLIMPSSKPTNQIEELKKIPTVELPEEEDGESDRTKEQLASDPTV